MTSPDPCLGIDLGTTNSAGVLFDGERPTALRMPDGGVLLPSVVRMDARGNVTVGARARRFLDSDPENTRHEFKRLMGSGRRLAFRAAKVERSPEELSAAVLSALRAAAERALGYAPSAAVITVPALFELPQIRATAEAARIAGFARVEHLQEPVASALTAGWAHGEDGAPWLVYDVGGGTFDVSLLETREGVLRVVDHDGDNFLGGRDMDARILDHVVASLERSSGRALSRSDPALGPLFRRLRAACEDAKIELGAAPGAQAVVSLPDPIVVDGEEIIVDVSIDARELDALIAPVVDRTVDVCLRLLERKGLAPDAIARMVLVGGPTMMPALRERLRARLGVELATDVDPMTAVAEGAARFAAEHGLSARAAAPTPERASDAATRVWLQYPAVSGDLFPYVVGRVEPGAIDAVRLERADGGFRSREERVDTDGSFAVQVELAPRAASSFRVVGSRDAKEIPTHPSSIAIRHGVALADPPLSRTIGVALGDGSVAVYFEKGAPLPARKTFRLRTSYAVHPGQAESAISVPVVQGEVELAHLCRLVGRIEVRPDALKDPLPAGSPLEVVLEIDRGGKLVASAHLPEQQIAFDGVLVLVSPDSTPQELEERLARLRARTEELYSDTRVGEAGQERLVAIDVRLDEAETELDAARGGDPDALEKLRRLLIDADGAMAEVEALRTWPELEETALEEVALAAHWVSRKGTEMERRTLDEAMRSLDRARTVKSASDFGKRLRAVVLIRTAAAMRDLDVVEAELYAAAARIGEMRDVQKARAQIEEGERALAAGNPDRATKAVYALWALLPPTEEARIKAHGSGVQR